MIAPFLGDDTGLVSIADSAADSAVSPPPTTTGRYLITLKTVSNNFDRLRRISRTSIGLKIASTRDFKTKGINEAAIADADILIFHNLGVALLGPDDIGKIQRYIQLDKTSDIREEKIVTEYSLPNTANSAWGIAHTNVLNSGFTGRGVRVAVLDTGFDFTHPDFNGRSITDFPFSLDQFTQQMETTQDSKGHGTHCIGTACGGTSNGGIRYGIARDADIFVGKVLNNAGKGAQAWIVAGMDWAGNNNCKVVSMSLGSMGLPQFEPAYEKSARFIESKGGIVVAAAGNDSNRSSGIIRPVSSPANCPSILAVAALDANIVGGNVVFSVANFSNGTVFTNPGASVDIAAPGVGVFSSWPMNPPITAIPTPPRYHSIAGTSMATPHVAGILALLWEQFPNHTPAQIKAMLFNNALQLPLNIADIGAGMAQA